MVLLVFQGQGVPPDLSQVDTTRPPIRLRDFQDCFNGVLGAAQISSEIAWPGEIYHPKKGVCYIKPENAGRSRSPLGAGADGVMQWNGIYQVGVYVPRDTGERKQEELATQVMAAYPRGLTMVTSQGLKVIVTHSTAPAPVPYGDWSLLPVAVHWFATEP